MVDDASKNLLASLVLVWQSLRDLQEIDLPHPEPNQMTATLDPALPKSHTSIHLIAANASLLSLWTKLRPSGPYRSADSMMSR